MTATATLSVEVPCLETERLRFGPPSFDHFEEEVAFFASDRSKGVGGPLPREQVWRSLCGIFGHWVVRGYGYWSVYDKAGGAYCGRVGLWFPEGWPEPEVSWTVMAHAEGKGIAREAAEASRAYAYAALGWTTAISLISHDNARSIALAERLGAVREEDYTHPRYGSMRIYRHPGPEALR